jgi:hypothetical protein
MVDAEVKVPFANHPDLCTYTFWSSHGCFLGALSGGHEDIMGNTQRIIHTESNYLFYDQ